MTLNGSTVSHCSWETMCHPRSRSYALEASGATALWEASEKWQLESGVCVCVLSAEKQTDEHNRVNELLWGHNAEIKKLVSCVYRRWAGVCTSESDLSRSWLYCADGRMSRCLNSAYINSEEWDSSLQVIDTFVAWVCQDDCRDDIIAAPWRSNMAT